MTWQDQFKIMKRWYYRLQGTNGGPRNFFTSRETYLEDYFRAFFISCHQLKDWFERDKIASKKEIEEYINNNFALQLAGDICNFSKHAKLNTAWTGDKSTKGLGQMYGVFPSDGSQHYVVSLFKIESGGKEYDASRLVLECMNAWGHFLVSKSLPIPELMEELLLENFPTWQPPKNEAFLRQK